MRSWLPLLLLLALTTTAPAAVVYVDAARPRGGNGASWAHAFNSLRLGLVVARAGDQVWVAAGTYIPGLDRTDAFIVPAGVAVYGGFRGFETALDQRRDDPRLCVLSGEIGAPQAEDNSACVLRLGAGSRLDTLSVTRAYAKTERGEFSAAIGVADIFVAGTMWLERVRLVDNAGSLIDNNLRDIEMRRCEVLGNTAIAADEPLIALTAGSATLAACAFVGNRALVDGRGMAVLMMSGRPGEGVPARIDDCLFVGNDVAVLARNSMFGAQVYDYVHLALVQCTFVGNGQDFRPLAGEVPSAGTYPPWFYARAYDCIVIPTQAQQPLRGMANWDGDALGDPGFVDADAPAGADGLWFTADDGLRLRDNAPAAGRGLLAAGAVDAVADAGAVDALGARRPQGGDPEPGAYEIPTGEDNRAPVASAVHVTAWEDLATPVVLAGSDADGDALTVRLLTAPAQGTLTAPDGTPLAVGDQAPAGTFTYRSDPDGNGSGRGSFTFLVSDGRLASPPSLAAIDVLPVNDAPTIDAAAAVDLVENQPTAAIDLTGITAGGGESQQVSVTAVSGDPALLSATVQYASPDASARLVLVPRAGAAGATTVAVTVRDDGGDERGGVDRTTLVIPVAVAAVPAVVFADLWLGTVTDVARPFTLAATATFAPPLTWSIAAQPTHAEVVLVDAAAGRFTLAPAPGFSGDDAWTVAATDALGNRVEAVSALTVTGFDQARAQPRGDSPHLSEAGVPFAAEIVWDRSPVAAAGTGALRFILVGEAAASLAVASVEAGRVLVSGTLAAMPGREWRRFAILAEDPASRSTGWLPLLVQVPAPPEGVR